MTNGLLELTDSLGMDYYFVSVIKEKETLKINNFNNYCKHINKTVQLTDIDELIFFNSQGVLHVAFDYEREHYVFSDNSNQMIEYFKKLVVADNIHQAIH